MIVMHVGHMVMMNDRGVLEDLYWRWLVCLSISIGARSGNADIDAMDLAIIRLSSRFFISH